MIFDCMRTGPVCPFCGKPGKEAAFTVIMFEPVARLDVLHENGTRCTTNFTHRLTPVARVENA